MTKCFNSLNDESLFPNIEKEDYISLLNVKLILHFTLSKIYFFLTYFYI